LEAIETRNIQRKSSGCQSAQPGSIGVYSALGEFGRDVSWYMSVESVPSIYHWRVLYRKYLPRN
jgi:hypothetical protein